MDQGTGDITKSIELLQGEAWVRLLASGSAEHWTLRYLHAVSGPQPPAWIDEGWIYEDIAFVSEKLPMHLLKSALADEEKRQLWIGGIEVEVPRLSPQVQLRRRPSHETHDRERLHQPTYDLQFHAAEQSYHQVSSSGYLVGRDCPSFPDVQYAFRAFFEGDYSLNSGMSLPSELMVVRFVSDEGWIGPIHVTPTRVDVEILGTKLTGTSLEMYSPTIRSSEQLHEPGPVTFSLPDGLPASNVWFWLKRDGQWLDYRTFNHAWTPPDQLAAAGVHIDLPVDPLSVVEALLSGGEGLYVEFKRSLPETKSKDRNPYKTIAAFANGDGGTIVFGMGRDEVTVVGLQVNDITSERDRLANLIRSKVSPTPAFEVTPYVVDGKHLLVLQVQPGASRPYGIVVDPDTKDKPEYFVRRGASTYPALPSDLRESVLANQPQTEETGLAAILK